MAVTIKQGDSFPIFLDLKQDGAALTPAMVDDLEISIGEEKRYAYTEGTVKYDASSIRWYIWPTQEDTFGMEEGSHKVECRIKYKNQNTTNVNGFVLDDKIKVLGAFSREVL